MKLLSPITLSCESKTHAPIVQEENEEKFIRGARVIMNSRGFILTCAKLIPHNFMKIQFRRVNDESFLECALVAR